MAHRVISLRCAPIKLDDEYAPSSGRPSCATRPRARDAEAIRAGVSCRLITAMAIAPIAIRQPALMTALASGCGAARAVLVIALSVSEERSARKLTASDQLDVPVAGPIAEKKVVDLARHDIHRPVSGSR
jgi:hypothetical protein